MRIIFEMDRSPDMKHFVSMAAALVFFSVALVLGTCLLQAQNGTSGLTASAAEQLLTHNGGVWVLENVGGQRIESACVGKFTLQFKTDHQAESAGCHEGGQYWTTSGWKVAATSNHHLQLTLGGDTTDLDLIEHGNSVYILRLKLLSVLDPKSGQVLIHEYRFRGGAVK